MKGLGVVTFERPHYFKKAVSSVSEHLLHSTDVICTYDDGSAPDWQPVYDEVYRDLDPKITVIRGTQNRGVAHAKNAILKHLYDAGCDWLFVMEDDQEILSPAVLDSYIEAAERSGCQAFNFAHHGPANEDGPLEIDKDGLEIYLNCVGAFCMYSRQVIDTCGYMDESYCNIYEHCVYAAKIARAGLSPVFWRFPDLPNSKELLQEQPGSILNSAIRKKPDWLEVMERERRRFASEYSEVWNV